MENSVLPDSFKQARESKGIGKVEDQNDPVTMVLGLKDVRKCAHNWKTFQSGAKPGRIVIPSEVNIRETRQIPFEVDPPAHKGFRDLIDPWFKRPLESDYQAQLKSIIDDIIDHSLQQDSVEVVGEFALKLQSRALTVLLNIPYEESELWIGWGKHVFRSEDTDLDGDKAAILYDYIDAQIDKTAANLDQSLYALLLNSEVNGKKLSKEEIKGVMILTFAGGRDTIINAVTNSIAYFSEHPESLTQLAENPDMSSIAVEELIRYFSPLTHMGRVATEDTQVCEHAVKADTRISLCWASANRDERVFENPNEVVLDRKVNPHVGFGFGTHNCLGATHARQLLNILITSLAEKVSTMEIQSQQDNVEDWGEFQRKVGYDSLNVKFTARKY
ncbi:cytochrome P450 [Psychrosphaera sp. F3M07]|uniref:cytochrome P450 n=1 Tax=Psychrosphaera sp. F3M07 TaxID=2841560 RepID=UPI001C0924AE|nr:cytochrome P450 [Psychrosphaera sp. F3M07]MBU2918848.1 cytochrome P450 [Psychrosphaera sp. F3M07]